jgi:small-conductance mechanosensitive channel
MTELQINTEILLRASLLLLIGLPLLGILRKWLTKLISEKYSPHYAMLIAKTVFYIGFSILFVTILHEFGFKLGPLLGAAGILGVAIGFASQASVSNVISGFFLIGEKSFVVGDIININNTVGVVLSIDTLSVKLRVFDNQMVRIPNEMMLKSQVTNITRYPIRRASIKLSVAYKEDLNKVREVILDVVDKNTIALQEPAPVVHFDAFGSSSIDVNLRVWCQKQDFVNMTTSLNFEIKKRFDELGIEIPFPHVSLYAGSVTSPIPVSLSGSAESADSRLPEPITNPPTANE